MLLIKAPSKFILKIFQFPGSIWHSIKQTVSSNADSKEAEHKEEFSTLVKELGAALRGDKLILTLTVLPHVNSAGKYENIMKICKKITD